MSDEKKVPTAEVTQPVPPAPPEVQEKASEPGTKTYVVLESIFINRAKIVPAKEGAAPVVVDLTDFQVAPLLKEKAVALYVETKPVKVDTKVKK